MTTAAVDPATLRFEADRCANCFEALPAGDTHRPWLYCSDLCKDFAAVVRYWRKSVRTGKFDSDPDVRAAVGIRIAHLLAGGYNARARRIPEAIRAHVIERDKVCVSCGSAGEEIDHIDGDSNEPGNLQFLCGSCHDAKTSSHMVPATAAQEALVAELGITRVTPDTPALLCDDETFWEDAQRRLLRERKARLQGAGVQHDSSDVIRRDIAARPHHRPTPGWLNDNDDFSARGLDDDSGFGEDSYFLRAMHRDD